MAIIYYLVKKTEDVASFSKYQIGESEGKSCFGSHLNLYISEY